MRDDERGADEARQSARPAGPVGAGDPPPPPVAKASSGAVPPTPPPAGGASEQGSDSSQVEHNLGALLNEAEQQRDEYLDLAKRTKADFENYRKRMSAEVQAATVRGKAALIGELVHAIDNLERALAAAGIDPSSEAAPEEPLAQGILLTYRDLSVALQGNGIEAVDPTGEKFDPNLHEALSTQPVDGAESGTVVETLQKGYRLGDQLVRPARVVVAE